MGKLAGILKALDMSKAARMKRAAEQGFDTDRVLYHGTADDINYFDASGRRSHDAGWMGRGTYLTSNPQTASSYANMKAGSADPNVMPLLSGGKFKSVDPDFKHRIMLIEHREGRDAAMQAAQELTDTLRSEGYDGVKLTYRPEVVGDKSAGTEYVVFDPSNIRSVNAAFDPANIGKSDILGSVDPRLLAPLAGAGALGAAAVGEFGAAESTLDPEAMRLAVQQTAARQAKNESLRAFLEKRLSQGSEIARQTLEAAATVGSAMGAGMVGTLSRAGGVINPFMTPAQTEAGAAALENKLQYIPSGANTPLDALGRGVEYVSEGLRSGADALNFDQSVPYKVYESLPERAKLGVRTLSELAL